MKYDTQWFFLEHTLTKNNNKDLSSLSL